MNKMLVLIFAVVLVTGCSSEKRMRRNYIAANPTLGVALAEAVSNGVITHGLPKSAVLISIGEPEKTHGYRKEGYDIELWVYSNFEWQAYENVLFQDGQVVGWNVPDSVQENLKEGAVTDLIVEMKQYEREIALQYVKGAPTEGPEWDEGEIEETEEVVEEKGVEGVAAVTWSTPEETVVFLETEPSSLITEARPSIDTVLSSETIIPEVAVEETEISTPTIPAV